MPYKLMQRGSNGKYEVVNVETGMGHGKTTKEKAMRQQRLLYAIENNSFKPRAMKDRK